MKKRVRDDRFKLRIDAVMGDEPDVALSLARDLEKYHLDYFDQRMKFTSRIGE